VPTTPPTVTATTPAAGATGSASTTAVSATFSRAVDPGSLAFILTDASGAQVPGSAGYDAGSQTATFTPATQLPFGTTFTASVQAADVWGHGMASPSTWTFTTGATPPAYACPCTLFWSAATPGVANSGDTNSVELGTRFTPAVNGTITGVRFYKGSLNTGTHTGSVWGTDGTLLGTGTFSNETDSGWQTLTFATPVSVTAGTTYIASYHAPNGDYSYTAGYFSYPRTSYPLTAPAATAQSGNGLYAYSSTTTFPGSASSSGTNYWVDVVFAPSP
jgi:hypothetical protein